MVRGLPQGVKPTIPPHILIEEWIVPPRSISLDDPVSAIMIRTRCPHCNKLLGIADSAAGMVTTCPLCKQKFRAAGASRPAARNPSPVEEFPEVEVVEEADDVAARDDDDEAPAPKTDRAKKKKGKSARTDKTSGMAMRNRLMGAIGMAGGLFLIVFGILNQEILNATAQAKALNPNLEPVPRLATIGFGAILVLVGAYYLVIDFFRE
jgi:hypothetical protein